MPTHEEPDAFKRMFDRLTREQKRRFIERLKDFIEDLERIEAGSADQFRPGLRVKGYQGRDGVFEMSWAPDGRALFQYGDSVQPGKRHIEWLAVGTHDIF
ncbi:MAG: hypothetical protein AAGA37_12955 [Actinomycetota bacterium]